ncbi:MAG: putative signal transducing protein [Bacteroidota bacterium]
MNNDWTCIYTTQYEHIAEIVKAVLEDNGIKCFSLSKKDSAYLFGEIELYVEPDDVLLAKQIINKDNFE